MIVSCTDRNDIPDVSDIGLETIHFQYVTGTYTGSRANPNHYCWQDDGWNENTINSLDLFIVKDNIITAYWHEKRDQPFSTDCGIENTHKFLTVDQSLPELSTFKIADSDNIYLIANQDFSETSPIGKPVTEVLKSALAISHDKKQNNFVMTGNVQIPYDMKGSTNYNINIPLERIAAKIRITLCNTDGTLISPDNYSIRLCRYVTSADIIKDNSIENQLDKWEKELTEGIKFTPSSLSSVPCADNATWNIEEDLNGDQPQVYDNGCVFYTYPTDWYNYNTISRCKSADKKLSDGTFHGVRHHNNNTETHIEISKYNDTEPIESGRQVFAIVQATFKDKKYYYKVPVNRRFYSKNDAICFSIDELRNEILPLYRADRNHFYDIVALIDRPGAGTPEEAMTNPYFTVKIADMEDGGTFDYIYDETNTDHFDLDINQWEDGGETELE